ncbi:hypothetical protein [Streptomyces jumonjinensis]|uniref:hypothetical protein n=1 Tax=Streptomyces jumonjinensis TaxID=1945 RepID=UPI0037A2D007
MTTVVGVDIEKEAERHGPGPEVEGDACPMCGFWTCRCAQEESQGKRSKPPSPFRRTRTPDGSRAADRDTDPAGAALLALEGLAAEEERRHVMDQARDQLQIQYIRQALAHDLLLAIRLEGVPPEAADKVRRAVDTLGGVRRGPWRPE